MIDSIQITEPSDRDGQRSVRRLNLISAARRCETQRREQRQDADAPLSSSDDTSPANLIGCAACIAVVGYLLLWAWSV